MIKQTNITPNQHAYIEWCRVSAKDENPDGKAPLRFLYEHISELGVEISESADCFPVGM